MDLVAIHRVAAVQGTQVALYRQLAIHHRVLWHEVWLVEVICMLHVGSSQTCTTATAVIWDMLTLHLNTHLIQLLLYMYDPYVCMTALSVQSWLYFRHIHVFSRINLCLIVLVSGIQMYSSTPNSTITHLIRAHCKKHKTVKQNYRLKWKTTESLALIDNNQSILISNKNFSDSVHRLTNQLTLQ